MGDGDGIGNEILHHRIEPPIGKAQTGRTRDLIAAADADPAQHAAIRIVVKKWMAAVHLQLLEDGFKRFAG